MKLQNPIPIVIIAGGPGHRIGGNKASRILAGETLSDRALQKAFSYSSTVAVSVNEKEVASVFDGVPFLVDEDKEAGPIAGLSAALKYGAGNDAEHVLIIPCDTPFLPTDLLERLCDAIGVACAAIAFGAGQAHAACSLWRTDAAQFLPDYRAQGRRSLIGFAKTVGFVGVEWPAAPFDPFFNINTPEELAHAEQLLLERWVGQ